MNHRQEEFEIIDAHVHPVTETIPGTNMVLFDRKISEAEFVAELKQAGISRCCGATARRLSPEELRSFAPIHELNLHNIGFCDRYPDFFIPGLTIHPFFAEESCREIETMHRDHGVNFVGELVAYMMGYSDYAVPELDPAWELIRDLDMAVNLHLNRIEEAETILRKFPTLKLIIAHPTASPADYDARLDVIAKYPNAALDISGSGPNMWGMVGRGLKRGGAEKILFGTDFPLRNPYMYVAGVLGEHLSRAEMSAVFSGNFRRLVNLG